jgi:hypothetical protein
MNPQGAIAALTPLRRGGVPYARTGMAAGAKFDFRA